MRDAIQLVIGIGLLFALFHAAMSADKARLCRTDEARMETCND